MDRREFLAWTGVGWVTGSLTAAISSLSFEPAEAKEVTDGNQRATFYTQGRYLYDRIGNKVILRGVNKMSVWDQEDPTGSISFSEISKTGANSVRIVWTMKNQDVSTELQGGLKRLLNNLKVIATDHGHPVPGCEILNPECSRLLLGSSLTVLDALITNAKQNRLIPMIELHDATGDWHRLQELVNYWVQPAIVRVIQKHQEYLLVNIGNEVGDDQVSEAQFIDQYTSAIQTMRAAGIHTPLVIDASDWGKNLDILDATADHLIAADPEKNLLFSAHLYWAISDGADANFIRSKLQKSINLGYPLIVGEFSSFGGYAGQGESICSPDGEIDYKTIIEECHNHEIGWYAWEWGPGNGFKDPLCHVMDMTPDRLFDNLKPGWATEVATSSPHSIKNTSVISPTL